MKHTVIRYAVNLQIFPDPLRSAELLRRFIEQLLERADTEDNCKADELATVNLQLTSILHRLNEWVSSQTSLTV